VAFDDVMARIAGRFFRVEPRRTARAFVLGLLSDIERKNCWWLAERAGHAGPQGMQRLLRTTVWDADAVRDDVRGLVVEALGRPDGVLIADETGFLKKGVCSVAVVRWGAGEVPVWAGPFPAPSSRTGQARFRASGSPVTTA
jgi:SRSO17 transposase